MQLRVRGQSGPMSFRRSESVDETQLTSSVGSKHAKDNEDQDSRAER